jgi:hypothetical protein
LWANLVHNSGKLAHFPRGLSCFARQESPSKAWVQKPGILEGEQRCTLVGRYQNGLTSYMIKEVADSS